MIPTLPPDATPEIKRLHKALKAAQAASTKACDRRGALPPGSSRAKVTTANAEWARAAEHRDRMQDLYDAAIAARS